VRSGLDLGQSPEANYEFHQTKMAQGPPKRSGARAIKKKGAKEAPWIVEFFFPVPVRHDSCPLKA